MSDEPVDERGYDMFRRGLPVDPTNHAADRGGAQPFINRAAQADTGGPRAPWPKRRPSLLDVLVSRGSRR